MERTAPDGEGGDDDRDAVGPNRDVSGGVGDTSVREQQVEGRQLGGSTEHLRVGENGDGSAGGDLAGVAVAGVDAHGAGVGIVIELDVVGHLDQIPAVRTRSTVTQSVQALSEC